jgi:hypothetical protein
MATDNKGDYVSNDRKSGEFTVPANLEDGAPFVNQTGKEVNISFSATGEWTFGPIEGDNDDHGPHGANGHPNFPRQNVMKYPDYVTFSLLAVNPAWNTVYQAGVQTRLTVPPGATLQFLSNDQTGWYAGNKGSLTIQWTADV